jgi:hypothetical protein
MVGANKKIRTRISVGDIFRLPFPCFERSEKCVYRINYSGGYFYIGSTKCLYSRMSGHKTNHCLKFKMRKFDIRWNDLKGVEIVAKGDDIFKLREIERQLVSKYFKDKKCLNAVATVLNNYGRQKYSE